MQKKHKRLLSDLNKIAAHLRLKLSKIDAVKNAAFGIDSSKKIFLFIDENDPPYFKTIDLRNVDSCTLKFDYSPVAGDDLKTKRINESIGKVQLQISHVEPLKSITIDFYDSKEDKVSQLQSQIDKATYWSDTITIKLRTRVPIRA